MKKIVNTDKAPAPVGPYSQSVAIDRFVYCSGQIPLDPATNKLVTGDIQAQTHRVMQNIEAVLAAHGLSWEHIIKSMIFLSDLNEFQKMNEVYASYFKSDPPARSCVEVARLPMDVDVEIEVIAFQS